MTNRNPNKMLSPASARRRNTVRSIYFADIDQLTELESVIADSEATSVSSVVQKLVQNFLESYAGWDRKGPMKVKEFNMIL